MAKIDIEVEGLRNLHDAIDRHVASLAERTEMMLGKVATFIHHKSDKTIPVDPNTEEGNHLKDTGRAVVDGSGFDAVSKVAYGTDYARHVHVIPSPYRTHGEEYNIKHAEEIERGALPRGSDQSYRFLQNAVDEGMTEILLIVRSM